MSGAWRRTASATTLVMVVATLVVLAFRHDGKPFTEVELNDGSVWVTNKKDGLVARLNPQVKELDLGVDPVSSDFDIFQRATDLFVDDVSSDRGVRGVDIARAAVQDPTSLPTGAAVAHGGSTFAVVDAVTGKAWVRSAALLDGFAAEETKPDLTDALAAAVGTDGRAYVLRRDGTVVPYSLDDRGMPAAEDEIDLAGDLGTDPTLVALTVVGDVPVLFDRNAMELRRPGADPVVLETADPSTVRLQVPSDASDDVYVATYDGLFRTSIRGGELTTVSRGQADGPPAAPVSLTSAGCVYAAWGAPESAHNYLRDCADDSFDDFTPITDMQRGSTPELQFRVNRRVVVLNDVATGDTWIVQEPLKSKVNNWPSVDPDFENLSKLRKKSEDTPEQENRPPDPQDDRLGARPGRTTVLPVVALNDHDPDGDIISISKTQHMEGQELEVKIVGGGTQLQVAVPADAEGTSKFRYYVTDGRVNEEPYAEVVLDVRDDTANVEPRLMPNREPQMKVTRGATADYYLLADFHDGDGDDLTLTDATAKGGDVEFRPDGTLTFTDNGDGRSAKEIQYTIEDGYSRIDGKLPVQMLGDAAPPELVPDLKSGVAGTRVVVQPLTNDRNPDGRELTLKSVSVIGNDEGTEITEDLESGTFTFSAERAKSYYLKYVAYNASHTKDSFIRLDIESPPKNNRPPIAVGDKAVVSSGGTAQVDLLLNDLDPDGDVLVVKRVGRASVPGVKVSLVDKRLAVISSSADFAGRQATVEYVVSDGRSSATGHLVIAQRQSAEVNRPPVANKDQVTVRAGSVTSIPVLANDSDPDGPKPRLFQNALQNEQDLDVWVAGDTLRLLAPEEPGTYSVIYGVRDADGLAADAEVSIYVVADSAKNNHAPVPQPIIDRVIGGRPKVISVDMVGADPDGDAVVFRGILTAPSYGRILDTGVDWLRYEAFPDQAGTDFFQILVEDKYGATGVAEVRVGVVPQEAENQSPVALDDSVLVQPDRTIAYNVLTNDVDPDDDPLSVDSLNEDDEDAGASQADGFIELDVGKAPEHGAEVTTVGYTIRDAAGAEDNAVLKVSVSRTAPFYAPIARDDVADLGEVIGRAPGESVEIPVLDNDLDFDGAKRDLRVTGCDAGSRGTCEVTDAGTTVKVELKADDQIVLYQLDDADEESAETFGVIFVSGTDNVPPQLTTDERLIPVKATAGEEEVIDLRDIVVTRADRTVRIAPGAAPAAINGAVRPVEDAPTSIAFTPRRGHVGPASVTVEVSDGTSAGEEAALSSLLTIPIDVAPAGNVAPVMRNASVEVTDSDEPVEIDLAGLTTDPNEGDLEAMTYTVESAGKAVTADITPGDSILSVDAARGAEDGDVVRVDVAADDGNGGRATAVVTVRVVVSNRPLLQVSTSNVTAELDERVRVDVAERTVNPYPGEPIEVSDPQVEGTGTLVGLRVVDGSVVEFTPTTSGTSTVTVTVADASGDPARNVVARINVTVVDVPEAPDRPVVSSVESSSVVLSWRAPEANGAEISRYEVEGSHGYSRSCPGTTCRLDGLTPGSSYEFWVRAVNAEGASDDSPRSLPVEPNKAPDIMSPPTIAVEPTEMNQKLTVTWAPPRNEGSPILRYEIKEAGGSKVWRTQSGEETSYVVSGLTNGTRYAFEIRAINDVEPYRQFSTASKAVAPFGVPQRSGAPPRLAASEAGNFTSQPWVEINWAAWTRTQSNGNAVSSYTITCQGCHQSKYVVPSTVLSKKFDVGDGIRKGTTFTFTVAATNDAGTSDPSPPISGRPWTKASPVRDLREVGESPSDGVATITWDRPADDGGLAIQHYVVQTDTGLQYTFSSAPGSSGRRIDFGRNGSHRVSVWAVTYNDQRAVEGDAQHLDGIATWGRPGTPSSNVVTSNDHYKVYIPVNEGSANGTRVTGVEISVDGGPWQSIRSGSSYEQAVAEGGSKVTILARTVSEATGERKYSLEVPLSGFSKEKELSIGFEGCILTCSIKVRGAGFVRSTLGVTTTLSGVTPANDKCTFPHIHTTTDGAFNYTAGENGCRVEGSGSATVSVGGLSASDSR